jgi:hypothetical protein
MNKKYIIEFMDINVDYEEDVEGNLQALFSDVVDFASEVKITDITDGIDDEEEE